MYIHPFLIQLVHNYFDGVALVFELMLLLKYPNSVLTSMLIEINNRDNDKYKRCNYALN